MTVYFSVGSLAFSRQGPPAAPTLSPSADTAQPFIPHVLNRRGNEQASLALGTSALFWSSLKENDFNLCHGEDYHVYLVPSFT